MESGPLKKQSLVEQAIGRIERMIETEAWPVGSRIPPEPELVQAFGVSRNCLREAVKSLVHVGVLEARQGDGTYVVSKSGLDALLGNRFRQAEESETVEVRACLEREIARLAARRRRNEDIEEIRNWLRLSGEAYRRGDLAEYVRSDYRFHLAIAYASGNRLLISLYENIADAVQRSVDTSTERGAVGFDETERLHGNLLAAIEERNPERAEEVVRELLGRLFPSEYEPRKRKDN